MKKMNICFAGFIATLMACSAYGTSGASEKYDPSSEGIRPVKVIKHTPIEGGADYYKYDWPVAPGPWPMVTPEGVLRYPMGAYGAGHLPGPYKTIEQWWLESDFDFVHFQADVQYGMSGKDIAERNIKYVLDPADQVGRKVIAHVGHPLEMLGLEVLAEHINTIKDHPALWAYESADEPSRPDKVIYVSHIFQLIRALDQEHPILLNDIGNQKHPTLEPRISPDKPDFYSWDIYPVQSNNGVSMETGYTRKLVKVCKERGIVPSYCLGNFAKVNAPRIGVPWFPKKPKDIKTHHYGRFSTVEEIRSQVYQSVISDVKMLLWWPYKQWVGGVYNREDLRETTHQVNREIHALTGPIFSKMELPVSFEFPKGNYVRPEAIVGMAKIYREDIYIIVANIAEKNAPLGKRKPENALSLTGVKIIMDKIPALYRRMMDDKAEILFEIAEKDSKGAPVYVKQKTGKWRTVPIKKTDVYGKPAKRFHCGRGKVWGAEWTGESKKEPSSGTPWGMWEGKKASASIVDDFGPYEVHVYRIKLKWPK